MKKILIFVFLIGLISCVDSDKNNSYYSDGSIKQKVISNNFNRICYEDFYQNGNLKIKACKVKGEYEGLYKAYHINGKPKTIANFHKGKLDGLRKTFHLNGELDNYKYYQDDEFYFVQIFEENQISEKHVVPKVTQNKLENGHISFDLSIPFIDSLEYYNDFIDLSYKLSNDSIYWGKEKELGKFRLNKNQNRKNIELENGVTDSLFIKILSVINGSKTDGYLEVKRIK